MDLKQELLAQRIRSESSRDQSQVNLMQAATEALITHGVGKAALGVGDIISPFQLPNAYGKSVDISDLLKNGPLIITFYRGSWCPYCNLELRAYQSKIEEIHSYGAQVVAISPELPDSSLSNTEKLALSFEVLSDFGNVVAREFGLVFKLPENLVEVYKQLNSDITKHNGDASWELPIPATYVVGTDHRITFAYANPDYLQRVDPQQVVLSLADLANK